MQYLKLIKISITTSILLALSLSFSVVSAQDDLLGILDRGAQEAGYDSGTDSTTLASIAGSIVAAFLSLIGIIFITYLIYGGYLWMTAAGNDEKITKAKSIIRNGIIGLIVTFSAATIYYFVVTIFGYS